VASLLPKKDHVHLMDAFARVVSQVPDARLLLVGEGPLKANLQHHARRLGLADAVQFAGYQVDVAGLLKGADLFVLSSLEEGMPNALLEAMSAGLPSVVTNVGGMAETIEDGRGGYLVPPERPELLAERWCALLRDPDLRMRMGAEARRRYETGFTLQRMAGAYQTLYDELIGP
jgi:glycosyltransferase involved in cell wall biosynthesis